MGLGEVGANIFMILVPEAKIGALRATSYAGKLATAAKIGDGILVGERGVALEAVYQARYTSAYERGLAKVDAELAAGEIGAPLGQPAHLFKANRVDAFARADLKAFALGQGHGTGLVRINQRLYLQGTSGPYRVPDLYFPQSKTIFDGTLGTKSLTTQQIVDFRAATDNAPVGIVRPDANGGFYWLGN
jgi:hypothetical protein